MIKGLSIRSISLALLTVATCTFFPIGSGLAAPSYEIIQSGGTGLINSSINDGKLKKGAVLELSCIPDEGYYFKEWHVTEGAFVKNNTSQTDATVVLPDNHVGITASFGTIETPVISAEPVTAEFTGSPICVQPVIEGGIDLAQEDITILYTRQPDGMPTEEAPTEVGDYNVSMDYAGNAQNNAAHAETTLSIVKMNMVARPAYIISAEADRASFFTECGQRYMVLPSTDDFPTKETPGWIDGFGDNYTWENLDIYNKYIIYTYMVETPQQTESEIIMTEFYTLQYFQCEIDAADVELDNISFTLAEHDNIVPMPVVLTITNTGIGTLKNVQVDIEGDIELFNVDTSDMKRVLNSGESNTLSILPVLGAPNGNYSANISISAIGIEGGYTITPLTESIDVSYTVYQQNKLMNNYDIVNDDRFLIVSSINDLLNDTAADGQKDSASEPSKVLNEAVNTESTSKLTQSVPLQMTKTEAPVLPVIITDVDIPDSSDTTQADLQDDGGLIASLNSAGYLRSGYEDEDYGISDYDDDSQAGAGLVIDEQTPPNSGTITESDTSDLVASTSTQKSQEDNKSIIKSLSSVAWFYGLIILAAIIFTLSIFYVDSKERERQKLNRSKQKSDQPDSNSNNRMPRVKKQVVAPQMMAIDASK